MAQSGSALALGARGRRFKSCLPDVNVTLFLPKEQEYVWRVAKAHAKEEGISLSKFVTKALLLYCSRGGTLLDVNPK